MRLGEEGCGDMGLGDLCMFTAVARGLYQMHGKKILPYRPVKRLHKNIILNIRGKKSRWIKRDLWDANPHLCQTESDCKSPFMYIALPDGFCGNYISHPTDSNRWIFRKPYLHHLIQMCNHYGIQNPPVKCDLFFTDAEQQIIQDITAKLPPKFITIEPHSQTHVMPNRAYPFAKWQLVVDALKSQIPVVQIGAPGSPLLDGVIDLTGQTTFKIAAGIAGQSQLFVSVDNGLTHAVTATDTIGLIVLTGWQPPQHFGYPQNINIYIANHGPCGLKNSCPDCQADADGHDPAEIITAATNFLTQV